MKKNVDVVTKAKNEVKKHSHKTWEKDKAANLEIRMLDPRFIRK